MVNTKNSQILQIATCVFVQNIQMFFSDLTKNPFRTMLQTLLLLFFLSQAITMHIFQVHLYSQESYSLLSGSIHQQSPILPGQFHRKEVRCDFLQVRKNDR